MMTNCPNLAVAVLAIVMDSMGRSDIIIVQMHMVAHLNVLLTMVILGYFYFAYQIFKSDIYCP